MTAPLWLPGATIVKALQDGGSMLGADAYVTWHTFECDYSVPALNGARVLNSEGFAVHIVFHPVTGDTVAMIPAYRAGRGLLNEAGGVETNRQGRVNIQIEVIGRASRPWTKDLTAKGRAGLARILAWLDDLGVPRTAPNGYVGPTTYAASTKRARSVTAWNGPGGYFCHADVPENDHWDHGAIDLRDLWAVAPITGTTQEDDMPDPQDLWNYTITGPDGKFKATAAAWLSYANAKAGQAARDAGAALAVVKALAAKPQGLTADEIEAAAKAGAKAALAEEIDSATVTLNTTKES